MKTETKNNNVKEVDVSEQLQLSIAVGTWMTCSVGMMVFNKLAITAFPLECILVALQMAASVVTMGMSWKSLHIGSLNDVIRWLMVVPFFTGMLLTSILALKNAPMTLVVTFRPVVPLFSLLAERFFPNPLAISSFMVGSIFIMIFGVLLYSSAMDWSESSGVQWVFINNFFAMGNRLMQRYLLAKDQNPVDISTSAITLLNNLLGLIPLLVVAFFGTNEFDVLSSTYENMTGWGQFFVFLSCIVGCGISYTSVWVTSLISATSFMVLINSNTFIIIFIEVFIMKTKSLTPIQILGATIAILGGAAYSKAREAAEASQKKQKEEMASETTPLAKDV